MTSNGSSAGASGPSLDEFVEFASRMVFDDGQTREPERWQVEFARDVFSGSRELWLVVPEGNGKSTFLAQLGLYGLICANEPWIPVGAASRDQAEIIYGQAAGFIRRTEALKPFFRPYDGYRKVMSKVRGGRGMKVYPHDPKTGDGVIPYPYALVDEPHRHPDMRLYGLWKGKLRKRGGQILVISTAGEPGSPFEEMRERIRSQATGRERDGAYLRAEGPNLVLHEYMVESDELCSDMRAVKRANPLEAISEDDLEAEFESPTLDLGDWKRFKCNRPTRSTQVAVADVEWDAARTDMEPPVGATLDLGLDWAPKWDTTAVVGLWRAPDFRLLSPTRILIPPRDGSSLHPDEVKDVLYGIRDDFEIGTVVMDMSRAEDIAAWIEDELSVTVVERGNANKEAVQDFNAFMEGLRNGTLKHDGDRGLRQHVMNAIARRLPGGDYRFDRPTTTRGNVRMQDQRVIDALTAAAMVVELSTRDLAPARSVYETRGLVGA